jgi:hypothetical protein
MFAFGKESHSIILLRDLSKVLNQAILISLMEESQNFKPLLIFTGVHFHDFEFVKSELFDVREMLDELFGQ